MGVCSINVVCSKCWGGGVSDKELTQESCFLGKLEPTDEVMAQKHKKDPISGVVNILEHLAIFEGPIEVLQSKKRLQFKNQS